MIKFILNPFDVLFFGSGKPFNFDVSETSSIFPPLPSTLAGAVSSKISTEKKIDTSKIIKNFYGPFLKRKEEILFPKPLDILLERKKRDGEISEVKLLKNSKLINPQYTDASELKELLWEVERNKEFEVKEGFITLKGLNKWLNQEKIDKEDLVFKENIFDFEHRIGIRMEYSRNVTKEEDALYRISYIRLKGDFEKDMKIIFFVDFDYDNEELKNGGLDSEDKLWDFFMNSKVKVLKLGGEMRCVSYECEREEIDKFGFKKPDVKKGDIVKILYLTPGFIEEFDYSYYRIISGSIKVVNLGINTKHYGIMIRRGIKEGSVIYGEVKDDKIEGLWLKPKIGEFIGCNLRIYTKL